MINLLKHTVKMSWDQFVVFLQNVIDLLDAKLHSYLLNFNIQLKLILALVGFNEYEVSASSQLNGLLVTN